MSQEQLSFLRSARAVRARAEEVLAEALAGRLANFDVELSALPVLVERVVALARAAYPDLRSVPIHGRYRHFQAGGHDRLSRLDELLSGASEREKLAARADLVITSVLLDAGAGSAWSYREASSGDRFVRSEGLAVASYAWFVTGGLSAEPARAPLQADASRLAGIDASVFARAFQVSDDNPLVGVEGRVTLLQSLAEVVARNPAYFGHDAPRPGHLALYLAERANPIAASTILEVVLDALGPIWPGRETLDGVPLGDVWTHRRLGRVPFHKLSQWLTYSLLEPLAQAGVHVVDGDGLTGLAEYRNGGLFIDGGVIRPKHAGVTRDLHAVGSDIVIEWRALTVALLDRLAAEMRRQVGLGREELPLAKILEAGTWRAGRILAHEKRPDGAPPIRVDSDGTVF